MPTHIHGIDELSALVGTQIGQSEWQEMTLDQIRRFADATGDHQWIHVDEERIKRESPFGAPIAHGYLTLSLIAGLFFEVLHLEGMGMIINYGAGRVRFPHPLRAGDSYRLHLGLGELHDRGKGWWEAVFQAQIQIQGIEKPACVAECLYRFTTA